jgi:Holliday junction resolvase RusA-like endonuclease
MTQSLADELLGRPPNKAERRTAQLMPDDPCNIVRLTIAGEPSSKANSRQIVMIGKGDAKRPAVIKSPKARQYEREAAYQIRKLPHLLTGPLAVTIHVFYASERPDLDESIILDVLQGRIYANDRQVREKHVYHAIDRANPRAEITVKPLTAQQLSLTKA